ncbi:MAG: hypothetical protein VB102_04640 [Paludibacter sp.]|nr:hypothetical protein [Paludibacter sp.]
MFANNKNTFIIILLMSFCFTKLTAQEEVDRNITVEREFQPVVKDAGKITTLPEILQISNAKERVDYSEIYQPLPFDKSILPLSPEEMLLKQKNSQIGAYVRLGMGNYWNTLGDVALPVIKNEKNRLDLLLNHTGTFGDKQHSLSQGILKYNHFFKKYDLYAGMNFSHEYFNYYGKNFDGAGDIVGLLPWAHLYSGPTPVYTEQALERITRTPQDVSLLSLATSPLADMLWRYNVHAGIRSLPNVRGHKYSGEINYDLFHSDNGLQEHIVTTSYGFSNPLGANRFGMDFKLQNMFYRQNDAPAINFWNYYAVFSMNPYYMIERTDWYLRVGVKTAFSFIHGRPFNPMPDVNGEWKILPKHLSVYGGVTGSFTPSTLNSIYAENPYVYSDLRVKDNYVPVNPYFGFKLKPLHNLLLDAFVDYRYIDDQYFFVNKAYASLSSQLSADSATLYTNRFNAVYSDVNLFRFGIRMNYNYKNIVNIQLKGVYNDWKVATERFAWMKPAIEADMSADVRVNSKLTVAANLFYEGKRYAKLGDTLIEEMQPKLDINLGASYSFNRTFSAFAKVNNLLNSKYEQFYGYQVQGINFLIGGAVSF